MKKIKKTVSQPQTNNTSRNVMIAVIIAACVLAAVITLIVVENASSGKITVTNDTSLELEYVRVYFEDESGSVATEDIFNSAVAAGAEGKASFGALTLSDEAYSEMIMLIKFKDYDEIYIYDGTLYKSFDGNITIRAYEEDGEYFLYAKASQGLFDSTEATDIDTDFILYLEDADWDYNYY